MFTHRDEADRRHLVCGQRAGLVGADDGGAPQRLDGGQLPDDHVPLRHAPGAQAVYACDMAYQVLREYTRKARKYRCVKHETRGSL